MNDEERELGALRPSVRPLLTAILANAALAAILLGWPYLRGRERARTSAHAVVELSACLLDGQPRSTLGLALPLGERERFATLYEQAPEDWPSRCAPLLGRVAHEPAIFLLPSPKAAEIDLAAAVDQMATALLDLESARAAHEGAVPEAPLESLALLRGLAASLLTANDLEVDPNAVGLDLGPSVAPLPAPSRVPVRTGEGSFWAGSDGASALRLVAADGLGIAEVEVHAPTGEREPARVRVLQLRRPGGARGVLVGAEDAWLAWTTADATCDADTRHCAMRATGLGRLLEAGRVMRPEHWIAAHPGGPIDRSIAIGPERFTIVARTAEGGLEARVVPRGEPIPPPPPNEHPDPPPPTHAIASRALPGALDWVVGDGRVVVLERDEAGTRVRWALVGADPTSDAIAEASPEADAIEGCDDAVLVTGARAAQVFRAGAAWPSFAHEARTPRRGPSYAESSLHLACDADSVVVGALEASGRLRVHRCTPQACETLGWPEENVAHFDLAQHGGRTWVASSRGEDAAAPIRVATIPSEDPPRVLAACWSSRHGMCGPAQWARGPGPLTITARDGSDVLALVRDDAAGAFVPLAGLATAQ